MGGINNEDENVIVSNSSSSSFIIAIKGENNKILKEFFEKMTAS